MIVHLVHMGAPTALLGATYTAHLALGLRALGCTAPIWQVGAKHDERDRHFRAGLPYQITTITALEMMARRGARVHITALDGADPGAVGRLTAAGATATVHGPSDLSADRQGALAAAKRIVVGRREMVANLGGLPARYVPYPYRRAPLHPGDRRQLWAVTLGRPGRSEGAHHLVAANAELPAERRVQMYRGAWPADDLWAAVKLARRASWVVDMSVATNGCQGNPYAPLEVADGGAALLLHRDRTVINRADEGLAEVATYVEPGRLAKVLSHAPLSPPPEAVDRLFARHGASPCARETFA